MTNFSIRKLERLDALSSVNSLVPLLRARIAVTYIYIYLPVYDTIKVEHSVCIVEVYI